MREYDVEPRNTYNMDEKGFFVGITTRSKRVFYKAIWVAELHTAAIRWVDDVEAGKHKVFIANSTSGWMSNGIELPWLEQVFGRYTAEKARRRWRLLLLDGYGSHLTREFIDFCNIKKILLAVFPPHATHTSQPLDVVLFSPLSSPNILLHMTRDDTSQGVTELLNQEDGRLNNRRIGAFFPSKLDQHHLYPLLNVLLRGGRNDWRSSAGITGRNPCRSPASKRKTSTILNSRQQSGDCSSRAIIFMQRCCTRVACSGLVSEWSREVPYRNVFV
jgi:hypothetical protein